MNRQHPTDPSRAEAGTPSPLLTGAAAVICLAAGVFALWLLFRFAPGIVAPFLLAWLISRLVRPLADGLHRRVGLPRGVWAAGLVILSVGGTVSLAVSGIRRGIRELGTLAEELMADSEGIAGALDTLLSRLPFLRRLEDTPAYGEMRIRLDELVASGVATLSERLSEKLPGAAMAVAGWVPSAFIFIAVTLLSCYYFSADDGRIATALGRALVRLTPASLRDRLPPIGRRLRRIGRQYLRACFTLSLITFLLSFIGLALLRIPYAFILAILIAAVDFLPLLGTGIVLIPWAAVSLLLGEVGLGIGLLILYAVGSVIRQILEPKLIGEGLGLHPLGSLFAMYAGLRLFGVVGMILAPLAVACAVSVLGGEFPQGGGQREHTKTTPTG